MERVDELVTGIVATLAAGGVKAVPFYRDVNEKELSREPEKGPLMYLTLHRTESSPLRSSSVTGKRFIFRLYATSKNLSRDGAGALGPAGTDGVYGLLETARGLLEGSRLSLPVQPLRLLKEEPFIRTERMTVYLQEWQAEVFG